MSGIKTILEKGLDKRPVHKEITQIDKHKKNIAPAEFASHIHLMKFVALTVEIITHASYNDKWYYYGQGSCIKDYGNPRWIE